MARDPHGRTLQFLVDPNTIIAREDGHLPNRTIAEEAATLIRLARDLGFEYS